MDEMILKMIRSAGLCPGVLWLPFKPCATYHEGLDWLIYLERDCSYTSHPVKRSNIELLYDNADGQLVGVKIIGFSDVVPAVVIKSFKDSTDGKVAVPDLGHPPTRG